MNQLSKYQVYTKSIFNVGKEKALLAFVVVG